MNQNSCESTKSWPQILIFPEGTCTNGQALIKYKTGAFQVCMTQQHELLSFFYESKTKLGN